MKIKWLTLENFRGVRDETYSFDDEMNIIKGKNGSGKSTVLAAYLWMMADRDTTLVSNPPVRPLNALDEVVTTVTGEFDFDGKPVEIQKSQKLKRSKTGTISLTNSYMVNSVPKSEKDFKAYLMDIGVDFGKFLACSHPSVALAGINNKKERNALRSLLFEMASDITDWDVATSDPELKEIAEMLKNYDTEEIAAIQNNSLRKIRENYGRDGEILRAKIEGIESAKVEVDEEHLKKSVLALKKEEKDVLNCIHDYESQADKIQKQLDKIIELNVELAEIEKEANRERDSSKLAVQKDLLVAEMELKKEEDELTRKSRSADNYLNNAIEIQKKLNLNRDSLEKVKKSYVDDDMITCPTCGRALKPKDVANIVTEFTDKKKAKIKAFEETIEKQQKEKDRLNEQANLTREECDAHRKTIVALKKKVNSLKKKEEEYNQIPSADMSKNKEYKKVLAKISKLEQMRSELDHVNAEKDKKSAELEDIYDRGYVLNRDQMNLERNQKIDRSIAEMKELQKDYEQAKANAEMILDQLKTLNMKKNALLEESVNKNFDLVNWKLFEIQKNGEYKDACIPMIGDKQFGHSMNTALEIRAKIDVMSGIQKFFKLDYPIVLDDAEHLDGNSMKELKTDHQMIVMMVSNDERLVFEH